MPPIQTRVLYYGKDEPLPETLPLRAGPLTALYDNGDLRYIRLGEHEILRRVYAAVRDHNWGTVPPALSDVQIETTSDTFNISYTVTNRQNDIDFSWQGRITGEADGTITFTFRGKTASTFQRNRIGFCILHPMDLAGKPCTITHVDGSSVDSAFPQDISPHQPYFNIRAITHAVQPGVSAEVLMEGDTFEMEDQRNWTDASYKTYCTPLGDPFPVTVEAGAVIEQAITIKLTGDVPTSGSTANSSANVIIIGEEAAPLPKLGLGLSDAPLSAQEVSRLQALNLHHLRVDVRLYEAQATTILAQAAENAAAVGLPLEVALWVSENAEAELTTLRQQLTDLNPAVYAWLIFHQAEITTDAKWVTLARQVLGDYAPDALFGGGTDAFFTELNRNRPAADAMDTVSFSTNPQVHAFANIDLVETLPAQAATVESARAFVGSAPITVSPITFFMRSNPNATGAPPPTPPGQLPVRVDVRQMSLFGAGWTAGSIKYLAAGGAASATYYETVGWLGVMEREAGSPLPEKFVSVPGGVYPMYHIFADVGAFAGGEVLASTSNEPLVVDALALHKDGKTLVLLVNFTDQAQPVTIQGLAGQLAISTLDASNAETAMRDPEGFWKIAPKHVQPTADGVQFELPPYAIMRIDG
jgi:hypothetical protein